MQSVNQVRQLYVAKARKTATPSDLGDVLVKAVKTPYGEGMIIQQMGEGGLVSSDIVEKGKIMYAKAVAATDLAKPLKQAVLVLDSSINSGAPVAGEDYVVDIQVSNYITISDESVLVKFGAVHATSGMSASDFYKALAKSFARNFSRDINKFFKFYLTEETSSIGTVSSTWQEVTVNSTHTPAGSGFTGIIISELPQTEDYVVGETPVETVNFKVFPHTVIADGDEVQPFTVKADGSGEVTLAQKVSVSGNTVTSIKDGYKIADLEWFCMGERGDQIRQMGYPRTIRTKYMVDPTGEYDVLDICFYYQGRGTHVDKSEKLLTIVAPAASHTVMNALIGDINTALGTSIATLS